MSTVIVLTICWGFSLLWVVAVVRAAARPTPKPPQLNQPTMASHRHDVSRALCASTRRGRLTTSTVRWLSYQRVLR
jgi:hypothetical protein